MCTQCMLQLHFTNHQVMQNELWFGLTWPCSEQNACFNRVTSKVLLMVRIDSEANGQAFNKLYATGAAHVLFFILSVGGLLKGC